MLPNNILNQILPMFRKKYIEMVKGGKFPKTVQIASNRAQGLLDGMASSSALEDRESAREHAVELFIYALFMFHFWGTPAKELKKYGEQKGRRSRLGNKGR